MHVHTQATLESENQVAHERFAPVLSTVIYHLFLLVLLLFSSFDVWDLVIVLYLELIVIGIHALLRLIAAMLLSDPLSSERVSVSIPARMLLCLMLAAAFISKYGLLVLGLGVALIMIPGEIGMSWSQQSEVHPMVEWCLWILLARYAAMFIWDSIFRADFRDESILRLLLYPYARGLWLAAAFAAGFVLAALNSDSAQFYFAVGALTTRFLPELIGSMFARSG